MQQPYFIQQPNAEKLRADWIITCEHASNLVPDTVNGGDLGLPAEDMARHIAYDPGAAGVSKALGQALGGPVILSNFSRLVIDPNRGEDDPTLLMRLYDGTIIPANRHADQAERTRRLDLFHRPYHDALTGLLLNNPTAALVSIHSFTPQLRGRPPRPWEIGVLYASDTRLADRVLARLHDQGDLCIGDNEPYNGELPGDAMDRHGIQTGRPHVLLELRNDLIADPAAQSAWAARLAPVLDAALNDIRQEHPNG